MTAFTGLAKNATNLTKLLDAAAAAEANGDNVTKLANIDKFQNQVRFQIDKLVNADQAATLARLAEALGNYDPLANDTPDPRATPISMADFVFGGAGRDVLIANTASDQLFDWSHDFNTYVATFTGKGEHVIVDNPDAQTQQLLIDMAIADGADQTRGGNMLRNGEPYGELGLVINGDADFAAQQGQSRDPVLILKQRDDDGRRDDGSVGFVGGSGPGREPLEDRQAPEPQRGRRGAPALDRPARPASPPLERLALTVDRPIAMQQLITAGYVVITNGVGYVTDQTWILLDLAEPPTFTSRTTLLGPDVTVFGRGDAGSTIAILDGTSLVATVTVALDGTWRATFGLTLGQHDLSATQTINAPPHPGLRSAPATQRVSSSPTRRCRPSR